MRIKKFFLIFLLIICIGVFFVSLNIIMQKYIQNMESKNANNNLVKIITKQEKNNIAVEENIRGTNENEIENENNNIEQEKSIKEGTKEKTANTIDWNILSSINKDIVGWIEIPNTNINYPILKDENLYYLNHTFEKKYNPNGSIFIYNQDLSKEKEIRIYGHNMKNGTMFASLSKFMNKDFFENNSKVFIYTKDAIYEGNFFAVYSKNENEENDNIKNLNLTEKLDYYKKQSINYKNLEIDFEKIIKLITCSYINAKTNPTDQRYYLIAKMKKVNL